MGITFSFGVTPLHIASDLCLPKTVKNLLSKKGIDVNVQTDKGKTPLHHAIESNSIEIVKILLQESSINPNIPDKRSRTPLHLAAKLNRIEIFCLLLCQNSINVSVFDIKVYINFLIERHMRWLLKRSILKSLIYAKIT